MTHSELEPLRTRNDILNKLLGSFKVFQDCLPLAIGIHRVIRERSPDVDAQGLRFAMRIHTNSTRYLKTLSQSRVRFDLDGSPAGEVTEKQRQEALKTLRERFRTQSLRRKAEQLAQQRQEKLNQLVEKFNSG